MTQLAVFRAVIVMFLSTPGMLPQTALARAIGIWHVAGAAFAINGLVEQKIDAMMCHASEAAHAAHAASYVFDPTGKLTRFARDRQDAQPQVRDLKLLPG